MSLTDSDLVAAALRGDPVGVAGMYDRYADRLHDYAWSVCRSHADAADIVQDTFVTGSQRLGQLRDPERLRPWLYAIARHHALRVIKQRERVEVDSEIDMITDFPEPDSGLDAQQLVWSAAGGLDAKDRDILSLHLREGLDGEDLAAALGIKPNAANVALFRVRERLEHAVGAVLLARFAKGACADLDTMMSAELTPLVRKRATRHIEGCDACQDSRRRVGSPAALFAAMPAALAPAALRDTVLSSWGVAGTAPEVGIDSWRTDGFPDGSSLAPPVTGPGPVDSISTSMAPTSGVMSAPPTVLPVVPAVASGERAVRRARLAAVGGIAAVVIGVGLFAALRSGPAGSTQVASLDSAPSTTAAGPGTALAVAPTTTVAGTVLPVNDDVAITTPPPTTAPPTAAAPTTATPTQPATPTTGAPAAPTTIQPATTEPSPVPTTASPAGPVFEQPVFEGPDEFAADSVNISVLEYECGGVMTVRLLVSASSEPVVVVRYEAGGVVVQDVELEESATEPNVYEGELEVFESDRRITARASAGSAFDSELLDPACSRIG